MLHMDSTGVVILDAKGIEQPDPESDYEYGDGDIHTPGYFYRCFAKTNAQDVDSDNCADVEFTTCPTFCRGRLSVPGYRIPPHPKNRSYYADGSPVIKKET